MHIRKVLCVSVVVVALASIPGWWAPAVATPSPPVALPWTIAGPAQPSVKDIACPAAQLCVAVGSNAGYVGAPWIARLVSGQLRPAILPIPAGAQFASLDEISCASTAWCVATGTAHRNPNSTFPFAALYSGGTWSEQALPVPDDTQSWQLTGVSCPAVSACWAVGLDTMGPDADQHLVLQLAGSAWSIASTDPLDPATPLQSVACTDADTCTAVGVTPSTGPVAVTYAGGHWSSSPLPQVAGRTIETLPALVCPTAGRCIAAGTDYAAGIDHLVAESLSAKAWTVSALPRPQGSSSGQAADLSCPSASVCAVVAQDGANHPFADTWRSGSWTSQRLPTPPGQPTPPIISAVGCGTTSTCVASGYGSGTPAGPVVLETLAAGSWSGSSTAVPGAPDVQTGGVACWAASTCLTLGTYRDQTNASAALSETESASGWAGAPLPAANVYRPFGTACPAAGQCVGIGLAAGPATTVQAIAQTAAGWSVTTLPTVGSIGSFYGATRPSCPTADWCGALISYDGSAGPETLAETRVDGTWAAQPLSVPSGAGSLNTVTLDCPAAGQCEGLAVGGPSLYRLSLSGGGWSVTPISSLAPVAVQDASCPTATGCVTVGQQSKNIGPAAVVTLRSGRWRETLLPLPSGAVAEDLAAVSCSERTTCLAVGSVTDASGKQSPVTASLSGTTWSQQVLPQPTDALQSGLTGVSCVGATACTAVGWYRSNDGGQRPMAVALA